MGRAHTPWSCIFLVQDADPLGIGSISRSVPEEWLDHANGGRRPLGRLHVTVLLHMTAPDHLPRLMRLAHRSTPFEVSLRELFVQRVERIKHTEVYCIGAALSCPRLKDLKEAWLVEEPADSRKLHAPYDSDGHVSIAYIQKSFRQQAVHLLETLKRQACGGSLTVSSLCFEDSTGRRTIPLGGDSSEPPAKVPRLSGTHRNWADIDGSVLEGGGQIVRMASAYAAIFGRPVKISKIRAGRKTPGLAAQHLEALRLVRDVSFGDLSNDFAGSDNVTLMPKKLSPGHFSADPRTAGAITLMVQASLFPLILAGGSSTCDLKGGTDVAFSPPLDFLTRVLQPMALRMGAEFHLECLLRGVYPKGGGHVRLTVPECHGPLRPIDLSVRGDPSRLTVRFCTTRALEAAEEKEAETLVRYMLSSLAPNLDVEFCFVPSPRGTLKYWADLVLETSSGALFHAGSEPRSLPSGSAQLAQLLERAASDASIALSLQLDTGAAVDEHLLDQLILPASLAKGRSRFLAAALSLHAETCIHIAERFLPKLRVSQSRHGELTLLEIDGVGHERRRHEPEPEEEAEELFPLHTGALSRAPAALHADFSRDMRQLSSLTGAVITPDVPNDRLVLFGTAAAREAGRVELAKVAGFYFG